MKEYEANYIENDFDNYSKVLFTIQYFDFFMSHCQFQILNSLKRYFYKGLTVKDIKSFVNVEQKNEIENELIELIEKKWVEKEILISIQSKVEVYKISDKGLNQLRISNEKFDFFLKEIRKKISEREVEYLLNFLRKITAIKDDF